MARYPRTWELLPQGLHDEVYRIAGRRHHQMGSYWKAAVASAAALAAAWIEDGCRGEPPLPAPMLRSDIADKADVRWRQHPDEEKEHRELIQAAGSTRTAVLVAAAHCYVRADGHLLSLVLASPVRLTTGLLPTEQELLALFGRCPHGCPVVSDTLSGRGVRLLSSRAPASSTDQS